MQPAKWPDYGLVMVHFLNAVQASRSQTSVCQQIQTALRSYVHKGPQTVCLYTSPTLSLSLTHTRTRTHTYRHKHTPTRTHLHTPAHTHTHTHAHINTLSTKIISLSRFAGFMTGSIIRAIGSHPWWSPSSMDIANTIQADISSLWIQFNTDG